MAVSLIDDFVPVSWALTYLQRIRDAAENYFQPAQGQLTPKAGNMIIFPSFLRHRPGPSPDATQIRISLCLDSYWTPTVAQVAET